ncbi:MAG: hypothetical protein PVH68_20355 [Armatimonadota bacterium]|jgi:hypothetical protein
MKREQRILRYLAESLELIRAGERDCVPIVGRLDNAAFAASIGGWKQVSRCIAAAEEFFLVGCYKVAERALASAVEFAEQSFAGEGNRAEG